MKILLGGAPGVAGRPAKLGSPPLSGTEIVQIEQKIDANSDDFLVSFLVPLGSLLASLLGGPLGPLGRSSGLKLAPESVLDEFLAPKRVSSKLARFIV